jgi:Flp pilus assembly protein TadG
VEFAVILPLLLLLILGAVEFGFVFNHHLTLEYATREGARVGASLADGSDSIACADVDTAIVAAVDRVLTSSGSPVEVDEVSEIRIYRADAAGNPIGLLSNAWTYTPGAGPPVDGVPIDFSPGPVGWPACSRSNLQPVDSLGVSLTYTYRLRTPFANLLGLGTLPMSDRTVMALNPDE